MMKILFIAKTYVISSIIYTTLTPFDWTSSNCQILFYFEDQDFFIDIIKLAFYKRKIVFSWEVKTTGNKAINRLSGFLNIDI